MYDFGLRLKKLRKSRGLTQKMLADRINKSVSAVSSYESNAQLPPLDVSKSIALALGISIDYLVGNEETPAYTAKNLTEYQAELLDELISEFHSPTNRSPQLSDVKAKLFCPEIAGLFCRIAGLFCHDSRANLSLKPVCFGIAIS